MNRKDFLIGLGLMPTVLTTLKLSAKTNFLALAPDYAVKANAREVERLLLKFNTPIKNLSRALGFDLANLAAAYIEKTSKYYEHKSLVKPMEDIVVFLLNAQKEDGTLDFGNLASPPDTAFIIDPLCAAARILSPTELNSISEKLKNFILKAADQLVVGGVHTPNHRWVVSAALAKVNALYPNLKYEKRIEEWLSEEVFADKDGVYLERSITYAEVVNRSLIFLAKYAQKNHLLKLVEKNLNWLYYMMEPNGDMVSIPSRRQDAFHHRDITEFYIHYRYMALLAQQPLFSAMVHFIEKMPNFEEVQGKNLLYYYKEDNFLSKPIAAAELPTDFNQLFEGIHLLRKRANNTSLTFFAGTDWPTIVASGRSTNPTLLSFRKGAAHLKYLRLATSFFSIGYIRGKGLQKTAKGYQTSFSFEAPYYQPMPDAHKRPDGDYPLSPSTDGRFWNKMDFQNRPISNVQKLDATISLELVDEKVILNFKVDAPEGVKVVLELCFDKNGDFSKENLQATEQPDEFILKEGFTKFTAGNDTISIGPGKLAHTSISGLEGEMYSTHFGSLKSKGKFLYLTGVCPFEHSIEIG